MKTSYLVANSIKDDKIYSNGVIKPGDMNYSNCIIASDAAKKLDFLILVIETLQINATDSILMKAKNPLFKVIFYEKSFHKSNFLRDMSKKFNLNSEIHQKNIFEESNLQTDIIIARAFKPLPKIFELMHKKAKNFNKIIIFLGKNGKDGLLQASKNWDIEYKQRISVTNNDSIVIEINRLEKK